MIEQLHGAYGTVYLQTVLPVLHERYGAAKKVIFGSKTLIRRIVENIVEYFSACPLRKPRISEQIKW